MDSTRAHTSRRQFLIGASVAAASLGALASTGKALASEAEANSAIVTPGGNCIVDASDMKWDRETDVLIIGCGGSGAAAALVAKENGADVLVLEANVVAGGCTAYSGQAIAAGGTDVQIACGIEDSPEAFADFMAENSDGDSELTHLVFLNSLDTYNWMEDLGMTVPPEEGRPGVTFGSVHIDPEIPRTHWTTSGVWPVLLEALDDNNIEVLLETPCTALISDITTGEIVGAMSGDQAFKARKAVILACGGITNNPDLVHQNITTVDYVTLARDTDQGDGLKLAESVGAAAAYTNSGLDTPCYTETACTYLVESSPIAGDPPFIAVNKYGQRFMNEVDFLIPVNKGIMNQPEGVCYIIAGGEDGVAGFVAMSGANVGQLPSTVVQADSIEELAEELGLDPEALKDTVDKWNEYCAKGVDEAYGRTETLKPLDEPPFGADRAYTGFTGTLSSVLINTNFEVQSALTGKSIGRLYAVGDNGSSYGRQYVCCGTANCNAITSGRLAGAITAALDPWE